MSQHHIEEYFPLKSKKAVLKLQEISDCYIRCSLLQADQESASQMLKSFFTVPNVSA